MGRTINIHKSENGASSDTITAAVYNLLVKRVSYSRQLSLFPEEEFETSATTNSEIIYEYESIPADTGTLNVFKNHEISLEINLEFDDKGDFIPYSDSKAKMKTSHSHLWYKNSKGEFGRKRHDKGNMFDIPSEYQDLIDKIVEFNKKEKYMEEVTNEERKIVLSDFYGKGDHVYEDDLGWREEMKTEYWDCEYGGGCKAIIDDEWLLRRKTEAPKCTSKEVFDFQVVRVGLNLAFYYIDDDTFYGIHTEQYPIEVKILPRDRSEEYLGWQCEADTHDFGEVIASFDDEHDIWDNLRINGKSLEEVLERSYIMALN